MVSSKNRVPFTVISSMNAGRCSLDRVPRRTYQATACSHPATGSPWSNGGVTLELPASCCPTSSQQKQCRPEIGIGRSDGSVWGMVDGDTSSSSRLAYDSCSRAWLLLFSAMWLAMLHTSTPQPLARSRRWIFLMKHLAASTR